jgi:hypothetical protein
VFTSLLDRLGERVELVKDEVTRMLTDQFGDDPVEFPAVALLGLGSR